MTTPPKRGGRMAIIKERLTEHPDGVFENVEMVILIKLGTRGRGVLIVQEFRLPNGKVLASWAAPVAVRELYEAALIMHKSRGPNLSTDHWTEVRVLPVKRPPIVEPEEDDD